MANAMTFLLYASILAGVPLSLTLAWHGKLITFAVFLAAMALIALLSAQGFEVFRGAGAHSKAGMALEIVGPWALGITVATGVVGWILYVLGDANREKQALADETSGGQQ
jgi:hypothetical protein